MIIEQHYDDEILIGLLESGDDMARDKHVSSCQTCAGALESLRAVTTGLQEATVWDERELPETPNRQIKNAIRELGFEPRQRNVFYEFVEHPSKS